MEFRRAGLADAAELGELMRRSVEGLSSGYYTPEETRAAAAQITIPDRALLADGTMHVAVDGSKIVGCGGWSYRRKLYTGSGAQSSDDERLDPKTEPARIRAFFIDPAYAGLGLGRRLYERCAEDARTAGFRRAELLATLPGVPFYLRLGFQEIESSAIELADGTKLGGVRMAIEL